MSNVFQVLRRCREDVRAQSAPDFCDTASRKGTIVQPCPPERDADQVESNPMTIKRQNSPFVAEDQLFLSEVIERLDKNQDITPTRRRDLKSAIRALARLVNGALDTTPANINWLHVRLRQVHPAQHGISKKRFQNIKSDALKALELTGASRERKDWLSQPSSDWQELLEQIPNKQDQWKLTQLAQFCSALRLAPADLCDQHV